MNFIHPENLVTNLSPNLYKFTRKIVAQLQRGPNSSVVRASSEEEGPGFKPRLGHHFLRDFSAFGCPHYVDALMYGANFMKCAVQMHGYGIF